MEPLSLFGACIEREKCMKRYIFSILFLTILILNSSCADFVPLKISGRYESESPKMYIVTNTDPNIHGHRGEMITEDGSVLKIGLTGMHGRFAISEIDSDDEIGEIIFYGDYQIKGDTLILQCEGRKKL